MKEDDFRRGPPRLGSGSRDDGGHRELSHRVLSADMRSLWMPTRS